MWQLLRFFSTSDGVLFYHYHYVNGFFSLFSLYVLDWVVKIFFWLFVVSLMASWFEPVKSVLSLGGPVVKHLPLVGSTVFDE